MTHFPFNLKKGVVAKYKVSAVILTSLCDSRMAQQDHRGEILKFQQEERLLLKAWKNMSSALQQQTLDGDLRPSGPVQSFLSRQRQSSRRRRLLQPR
ncbi:protein Hook homolog isoform X2 [Entelurus aequoreus]|uniref:protein Hook homolog isoform X2 n=1 Tax=Entelurus aequoreus TaxID=161455 RepID=UPI002B1D257B|nr:protein Hook homolog isoform X2 [Entelurus aequoreus]